MPVNIEKRDSLVKYKHDSDSMSNQEGDSRFVQSKTNFMITESHSTVASFISFDECISYYCDSMVVVYMSLIVMLQVNIGSAGGCRE